MLEARLCTLCPLFVEFVLEISSLMCLQDFQQPSNMLANRFHHMFPSSGFVLAFARQPKKAFLGVAHGYVVGVSGVCSRDGWQESMSSGYFLFS